jgi:hypothetical protein
MAYCQSARGQGRGTVRGTKGEETAKLSAGRGFSSRPGHPGRCSTSEASSNRRASWSRGFTRIVLQLSHAITMRWCFVTRAAARVGQNRVIENRAFQRAVES